MPKTKISEYSATANSNTDVASINIDEGCAPSGINNAIRAVMGHLKDFQQGTNGDPFNGPVNGTLGATTASTANVTTLTTSSTVTHNGGTANGVGYLNGSKVLTTGSALTFDGTNLGLGGTNNSYGSQTTMTLSGTNVSRIDFRSNSVFTGTILSYQAVTEGLRLQTEAGYPITFYPAGTEAMRIGVATGGVGAVGIGYSTLTSVGNNGLAVLGNVGIGTSSPTRRLTLIGDTTNYGILTSNPSGYGGINLRSNTITSQVWSFIVQDNGANSDLLLYGGASAGTKLTIDSSGNLLVGTTSFGQPDVNGAAIGKADGAFRSHHATGTASGTIHAYFTYGGLGIGSITQNGTTGVLYNLTSDYRLKNDQQALTGAKDFIMSLKPKKWQWWDGSGEGVGFIAHEFMEVAKHSGNGEKDAVDSDGKPVYQSIQPSSSEVMANLVAFVQELKAEFDAYKASHP